MTPIKREKEEGLEKHLAEDKFSVPLFAFEANNAEESRKKLAEKGWHL